MWIIKPEQPEWKRTIKNINPNALTVLSVGAFVVYMLFEILIGLT